MKLSQVKAAIQQLQQITFALPNGQHVPEHFHVTEVGKITKHFIDCGGEVRTDSVANFQLWNANDFDHRLAPQKLLAIIELSEQVLALDDLEVEVEYQNETISKFGLEFDGTTFRLTSKHTDCLASDKCGVPQAGLGELSFSVDAGVCAPGSGCC